MTRLRAVTIAAGLTLIAAGAFAAGAVAPATMPATGPGPGRTAVIGELFARLEHPQAAMREDARLRLMGLRREELDELRELVQAARPLPPGQAAVLHDVVVHVYLAGETFESAPRQGFLGVMLQPILQNARNGENADADADAPVSSGVLIMETNAGFAGFRFLRVGDVVVGTPGGRAIGGPSVEEFKAAVNATAPGQTLNLQVLRQGRVIDVGVEVSAAPALAMAAGRDVNFVRQFQASRLAKAEEYWRLTFAPLLDGEMS